MDSRFGASGWRQAYLAHFQEFDAAISIPGMSVADN